MTSISWMVIFVELFVGWYATNAVCSRRRRPGEQRGVSDGRASAMRAAFGFAMAVFLLAIVLDVMDGGRRFKYVREIWEVAFMACTASAGIAIRILKGDHGKGSTNDRR